MNGSITKLLNGKWLAECGIQDGTERRTCDTEAEARRYVRDVEHGMNGNRDVKKKHIPAYEEVQTVVTQRQRRPL